MQIFYTVRAGDTLSGIAGRWMIPLRSLAASNNLNPPFLIYPGDQLSMPPGVSTYVVNPGDTIYSISIKYGIPMASVMEANGIEPPYVITPGMVLIIPRGVTYYVVRQGDTLYSIARKYNVEVNGQPRPDLIIQANYELTPVIYPGIRLIIHYPPAGGVGRLAALMSDGIGSFIQLYSASSGETRNIAVDTADRISRIYWSHDGGRIAYIDRFGIISIINVLTGQISKIDQIGFPAYVDWSRDNKSIVYSTGNVIRIYDIAANTSRSINRPQASYIQWLPDDAGLLYEAKDTAGISQLYISNTDGSGERVVTNNTDGPMNEVGLSPNGRYVLYTSPGASISEIYTIELVTGRISRIPGGPEAKNFHPIWSPDSKMIAYSATQFIRGRYYSVVRVSGPMGEGDSIIAVSDCYATPVAWSPDSRKLAYLSGCREDIPPVEVWVVDLGKPFPLNVLSGFFYYDIDW